MEAGFLRFLIEFMWRMFCGCARAMFCRVEKRDLNKSGKYIFCRTTAPQRVRRSSLLEPGSAYAGWGVA